jgi:hypothetical protein
MRQKKDSTRKPGEVLVITTPEGREIKLSFHKGPDGDVEVEMDVPDCCDVRSMTANQAIWLSDKSIRKKKNEEAN